MKGKGYIWFQLEVLRPKKALYMEFLEFKNGPKAFELVFKLRHLASCLIK